MKKGYTLLELLIVVIIIAILAAIVIPKFQESTMDETVYAIVKHDNIDTTNYEILDIRDDADKAWAIAHALEDHSDNYYSLAKTTRNPKGHRNTYYVEEYSFNGLEVPK